MKRVLVAVLLLSVFSLGTLAQTSAPPSLVPPADLSDITSSDTYRSGYDFDDRIEGYYNWRFPGSTFLLDIEAQREQGTLRARARVSLKFPEFGAFVLARIDFLEPAEVAGDVYITSFQDRDRTVFFWNPGLVQPLKLDKRFEIFGDATAFELIGTSLVGDGDYLVSKITPSQESLDQLPPSASIDDGVFSGEVNRLVDWHLVARPERRGILPFQQITVVSYNHYTVWKGMARNAFRTYKLKLFDESGDLLHTVTVDLEDYRFFEDPTFMSKLPYAAKQVIENHVVPGNVTTVGISNIEIKTFEDAFFDPAKLGK